MRDARKTKSQLIAELHDLRKRVNELETSTTCDENGEKTGHVVYEGEDRFQSILENINDLVYRYEFTPERGFTYVSPSAHQITGYTPEDHYADPDLGFKLVHPDDKHLLESLTNGKESYEKPAELRWLKKDGTIIWTEQRNKPVYDAEGNIVAIEGIARDITERKQAEEKLRGGEQLLRTVVDAIPACIYVKDKAGKYLFVNNFIADLYNAKPSEMIGKTDLDFAERLSLTRDESLFFQKLDSEVITKQQAKFVKEEPFSRADGAVRWLQTRKLPLKIKNNPNFMLGVSEDITERKHAEARLQESEASLARAQQISHLGNWSWDVKNNSLYWSDELYNIFKFNKETKLTYDGIVNRIHPDDREENQNFLNRLFESAGEEDVEFRIILPDGSEKYIYQNAQVLRDKSGDLLRIFGIMHDITERKKVEEVLRETRDQYARLLEAITDSVYLLDSEWRHVIVNEAATRFVKLPRETLLGGKLTELFPGVEETAFFKTFEKVMNTRVPDSVVDEFIFEDGRKGLYEVFVYPVPQGILCISRDITERKRAELLQHALFEISMATHTTEGLGEFSAVIQEKLGELFDTTNFFIALYDGEKDTISLPYFKDEKDDFKTFPAGKTCTAHIIKSGKPLLATRKKIDEMVAAGTVETIGTLSKVWLGVPMRLKGKITGAVVVQSYKHENAYGKKELKILEYVANQVGMFIEHKRATEALRESEERLKLALEVTKLGTWEWDLRTNEVIVNEQYAAMKGYTLEEIQPHLSDWDKCIHPDDRQKVMEKMFAHFKGEIPISEAEFRFKHKSGKWIWIVDRGKVIEWDEKGEAVKAIGTHFDITERLNTEQKLRTSEERYKKLSNLTIEGVLFHDNGIMMDANDSFTRITGYTIDEIRGKNFLTEIVPPEYHGIVREKILKRVATPYEIEIRRKDGRRIPVEIEARKIQENGNEYRVAAIRDITDRKKTEEELRISRRNFQLFVNSSPDLFFLKDLSLRYLVSNEANSAFFNKKESEILGKTDFDLMPPEAAENSKKTDMMAVEQKKTIIDTETVGDRIYETRKIPVYDHEKIIGVAGLIRDITERKKAERQLHLHSLVLNQIQDRVTVTDLNGIITYVNEAEVQALKYSREELIGKSTSKYGEDAAQGATQQEILEKTLEHGYWRGEVVNYTADGREIILDTRTMTVHDENGETIALCGISTDITERKKIEVELRENEEKFRLLAENSVDCIWTMDKKLRFTYLSPALERMTGYTPEEWVGTHLSAHFTKKEFLKAGGQAAKAIKNYKTFTHTTFESKILDKNNEELEVEISGGILKDEQGKLKGLQGTTRDITERKIAEKKLEYRLELEQLISDISARFVGIEPNDLDKEIKRTLQRIGKFTGVDRICIFMFSDNGDFANVTHEWRMRGIPSVKSKLQNMPVSEFPWVMTKLRHADTLHIPRVEDVPEDAKPEKQLMQAHGIKSMLMVNLACGRELLGFIGFDTVKEEHSWEKEDISLLRTIGEIFAYKFENRRFEQEREQLLHNLGERLKEMKLLYQVSQYSTDLEKSLDDFLTNTVNEIPSAWHYPELTSARIILNGKEYRTKNFKKTKWRISQDIHLHGRKAGSIEVCLLKNVTMPDDHNFLEEELNLIKSIANLVMSYAERKQAEGQIRGVNEKLQRIFDASRSAIIMVDAEGKITEWNRASEEIFGWKAEAVVGNFNPTVPENLMDFYFDTIRNKVNNIEVRVNHKDNKMVDLLLSNTPLFDENKKFIGSVGVMSDISDLKRAEKEKDRLEKQLRRSQKMETIGTLAGGIAHDFNNILTPIMGYTDMAIATLPQDDPLKEDLKHVLKGAHRAKELVQQILAFSRQIEQERKPLKLHLIVKEAIQLLRPSIPSTIEIRQRIDTTCAPVLADASQIHQVIVNLCTNANQAIGDAQGRMNIELTQIEVDEKTATLNPNLEPKEYVRLTVEDTGIGMDAETVERIFDPFFTTKDVDKGTGLGLSVVHGIVRSHHGDVHVQSEPGKGTTFHVFLPVAGRSKEMPVSGDSRTIQGGKENIMVVDDEQIVANVVKKMLAHYGYHVDVFDGSQSALKMFMDYPEKYDLIISDFTMPEINGLEFAKKVQHMRPDLPFILMTGYGENVSDDVINHFNIEEIIAKPIDRKVLAAVVRRAIEKS